MSRFTVSLLTICLCLTLAMSLGAGSAAASGDAFCVVLVSDESGSMDDNDPGFLRNTGMKLFVSLLDDGDRVGLVRFSNTSARVTPQLATVEGGSDKTELLAQIADVPPDGYTDIRAALQDAVGLLTESSDCGERFIVLLTDGKAELPAGLPAGYEEQTLALLRDANIPVLGIALTAGGESPLLYRLATATNPPGAVIPARAADDLLDAYLEVLSRLKDRTVVGAGITTAPGTAALPLDPGLAQFVDRVTFIVSKPAGVTTTLLGPDGTAVDPGSMQVSFSYTADPTFTVFTVDDPAPGPWQFALDGAGAVPRPGADASPRLGQARAILRSRLRVAVAAPQAYNPLGQPLPLAVSLIEEAPDGAITTIIGEASFSATLFRPDGAQDTLDRLYDDGTHGDALANDGVFTNEYVKTDLEGEYAIAIQGFKGVIPVTRNVRVLVVPFPQIVVANPSEPVYEIRGEALPLSMYLDGGAPLVLDTGGFAAHVTTPDGETTVLPLASNDGQFSTDYHPTQEGAHTVRFVPVDAQYKGAPYTLTAARAFEVRLIPALHVETESLALGAVEQANLARGHAVSIRVISTSPQPESLSVEIAGIPGMVVSQVAPQQLPPDGETDLWITLAAEELPSGDYLGKLLLSTREGLDLSRREIPIALSVYHPALAVEPAALELGEVRVDRLANGEVIATLVVASESLLEEPVAISLEGVDGLSATTETRTIAPGASVEMPSRFRSEGELATGAYSATLRLTSREGVAIEPELVTVTFTVVPVPWCSRYCLPVGIGLGVVLITGAAAFGRLASRPRPWGELTPTKFPSGQLQPAPITLGSAAGFLRPGQVVVGSDAGSAVRLPDGNLRPRHAAIRVVKRTVTERSGRPPRPIQVQRTVNVVENLSDGMVRVGGAVVPRGRQSQPLRRGTRVQFGEYEFEYRE